MLSSSSRNGLTAGSFLRWPGQIDGHRALALTVVAQAVIDARAVQKGRRRFAGIPMSAQDVIRAFFNGEFDLYADFLGWNVDAVRLSLRRQGVLDDGASSVSQQSIATSVT